MICLVELAGDLSALRAARVGDYANNAKVFTISRQLPSGRQTRNWNSAR